MIIRGNGSTIRQMPNGWRRITKNYLAPMQPITALIYISKTTIMRHFARNKYIIDGIPQSTQLELARKIYNIR